MLLSDKDTVLQMNTLIRRFNNFVHTWKSLSAFTSPPTSFLREKMIVALPFSDEFFFSLFSSIFVKVDLFIWKQ